MFWIWTCPWPCFKKSLDFSSSTATTPLPFFAFIEIIRQMPNYVISGHSDAISQQIIMIAHSDLERARHGPFLIED